MTAMPQLTALLSVSDKAGVVDFARALAGMGVEILSTGGTAKLLADAGVTVKEVSSHTGFPEIMDGRVKTLHPKIAGGLLGRRDQDAAVMAQHGIDPIDLVAVNLYPFAQQGFHTVTGNAADTDVLNRAKVHACRLCVVCVPDDPIASQIVGVLRSINPSMSILVRWRYFSNVAALTRAGADIAISEEQETSVTILRVCEQLLWQEQNGENSSELSS